MRIRGTAIAAVLAPALLVAACGGDGDDGGDPGGGTAETIRVALATFGNEQLDPAMESRSTILQGLLPMFDTVLEIAPDGAIVPGLAEEWTISDDGTVWDFTLREGVQFHDDWGEVTADDVAFSLDRWASPDGGHSEAGNVTSAIDRVEVVDDRHFKIHTKGVQAGLPFILAPQQGNTGIVFSKKYLTEEGGDTFEEQTAAMNENPVGSGPFKFVSHTRGSKIVMEAVENHWRAGTPVAKRVEFLLVPEVSTQVAMLKSGEADIIEVAGDQADAVEADGLEVRSVPDALGVSFIIPGIYRTAAKDRPTNDVRVREAMSLAIDRETILATLIGGRGSLPTTPWNTSEATADIDIEHFTRVSQEDLVYDPDRAKELLTEAGYANGVDVVLDTFNRPGAANLPQLAEIIAAQWGEVGIRAQIRTQDYGNYRTHWSPGGGPPPDSDDYNAGWPTTYSSTARFDAAGAARTYISYADGPIGLLRDTAVDEKIARINATQDADERTQLATDVFMAAHDAWVMPPLFNADYTYGVNPETVGEWTTFRGWAFMGRMLETLK